MNDDLDRLKAPGEVERSDLRTSKGTKFAEYLQRIGGSASVTLREIRRQEDPPADVIVFDIEPERPQKLKNDIKGVEPLAAIFCDTNNNHPAVMTLRSDFPTVPHLVNGRWVCLYDQSYADEKLNWTPANFLHRIHMWFAKTADGTLHPDDQPLEPLMMPCQNHLIVPSDIYTATNQQGKGMEIRPMGSSENTLLAFWQPPGSQQRSNWLCCLFVCATHTHGVIQKMPDTLEDLHKVCSGGTMDLLDGLCERIKQWLLEKRFANEANPKLIMILVMPKARKDGDEPESYEIRAFLCENTIREIGATLGIIEDKGTHRDPGLIMFPQKPDPAKTGTVRLIPVNIHPFLSATTAAAMNGAEPNAKRMMAVGAGAFGSQVLNNFVRAGFGQWTIVDEDVMMPHNFARHLLTAGTVSQDKATAVAEHLSKAIDITGCPMRAITADILNPGQREEEIKQVEDEAAVVIDLSASIAVERYLGRAEGQARRVSGFVTPDGNGLVILIEDDQRNFRLDWLEALHYRTILLTPELEQSLQLKDGRIRTGTSCRDLSTRVAQADMAMWAGMFASQAPQLLGDPNAAVKTFQRQKDGSVAVFVTKPETVSCTAVGNWTIQLDDWLLKKLSRFRDDELPNETGGVLLGILDTEAQHCLVVDALPSPPDSIAWPNGYIRGCQGLQEKVKAVGATTAGQVIYVGEWHSHPQGSPTNSSPTDLQAYSILNEVRELECLPTVMLIVGDDLEFSIVSQSSDDRQSSSHTH